MARRANRWLGLCALLAAASSAAGQEDSGWRHSITPYAWFANLDGEITVRGRTAEIEVSSSDLLDNLELAGALHYEAERGKWMLLANGFFYGAGQTVKSSRPLDFDIEVDVDTVLGEVTAAYRLLKSFALTLGGRYISLDTELDFRGPAGLRVEGDQDWFDPVIGFRAELGRSGTGFGALVVGNVGGFGVGSDFTWNLSAFVLYRAAARTSIVLGVRILDTELEERDGGTLFRYDIQQRGPLVGLRFHF